MPTKSKNSIGGSKMPIGKMVISKWYILPIKPMATPRPRAGRFGTHNDPAYTRYKKNLITLIKWAKVSKGAYSSLNAKFYFKFPKNTAKYKLVEGFPKTTKPDIDNLVKGLQDAVEQSGIITNDSRIHKLNIEKLYTIGNERIEFSLGTEHDPQEEWIKNLMVQWWLPSYRIHKT